MKGLLVFLTVEKPFLACFSAPTIVHFSLFPLESEPAEKTFISPSEVYLFSIRCEDTKISGIFTN